MTKDMKVFVTGEGPKKQKERREWSKAHTAEAVRLITEWLVSCKVQNMHSLEHWERETLQWTLTEMGFDIHTLIGDIFQQEIQPMLEYAGGEEKVEAISNGPMSRNQYFQWEAAGKVTTFYMCYDDYVHGISDYYKIQQCQKFLNGLRFLKSKNKEMWKAQGELLHLKADLKEAYRQGIMSCYSIINIGWQIALLKVSDYQIVVWEDYSVEGVRNLKALFE